jgi:hypothetical protein
MFGRASGRVYPLLLVKANCLLQVDMIGQMNQLGLVAFEENDEESRSRGLDNFTKARRNIRKARRAAVARVLLVLEVQEEELQFDEGSSYYAEPSLIADLYRDMSVLRQQKAQSRGFNDQ